jgi:3-phenylpropionate/trans-cinnamate dioxygenase ferredoxin subunit
MADFVKVAKKGDIPAGECRSFTVGDDELVIACTDGKYYAFKDECTHDGAPFEEDMLDGREITCPRHGATFDITTGKVTGPPALVPLETYELKIEGDDLLVNLG